MFGVAVAAILEFSQRGPGLVFFWMGVAVAGDGISGNMVISLLVLFSLPPELACAQSVRVGEPVVVASALTGSRAKHAAKRFDLGSTYCSRFPFRDSAAAHSFCLVPAQPTTLAACS